VVTCEIKLIQNYFSLCQRLSEIILPEIISKLFKSGLLSTERLSCYYGCYIVLCTTWIFPLCSLSL